MCRTSWLGTDGRDAGEGFIPGALGGFVSCNYLVHLELDPWETVARLTRCVLGSTWLGAISVVPRRKARGTRDSRWGKSLRCSVLQRKASRRFVLPNTASLL